MQRGNTNSLALTLPPLSGLSSLTKLDLSDCNLCEGAIPGDICCLSSLSELELSSNNFISLPVTLTRLSKLRHLLLSDCKELKSLPELLTTLNFLKIDGCSSLEAFPNLSTVRTSTDWVRISSINCYGLAENNNASTMVKKYLQVRFFLSLIKTQ